MLAPATSDYLLTGNMVPRRGLGEQKHHGGLNGMSTLGQKRTHAPQQKGSLFDYLVGGYQQYQ
jgi:hypothetical protein